VNTFHFSQQLFWDHDLADIDLKRNRGYVIERVLTRGLLTDFKVLLQIYTHEELIQGISKAKELDAKTAHFCNWYFNIPLTNLHVSSFYR
jgi:hypothetical protein